MHSVLNLPHVDDFFPNPDAPQWDAAPWTPLTPVSGPLAYDTAFQCLYSDKGLYFRFRCADQRLNCDCTEDMGSLYLGDVTEVFLWPCENLPVYFEYELSPLNKELPLMVCNTGDYYGWTPFEYEGVRRTRHYSAVQGGERAPHALCTGWQCGAFLPFALMEGVCRSPVKGDCWRGNFYRIDYDGDGPTHFAWDPDTGKEFHQFRSFGTLRFD